MVLEHGPVACGRQVAGPQPERSRRATVAEDRVRGGDRQPPDPIPAPRPRERVGRLAVARTEERDGVEQVREPTERVVDPAVGDEQ